MDDLWRIRKAPSLLGDLRRRQEAQRRIVGSHLLVEEVNTKDSRGGDYSSNDANKPAEAEQLPQHISSSQRCVLCRKRAAQYTCPQCNVPYCSLACFQAPQHGACARPFADKTLRQEVGAGSGQAKEAQDALSTRRSNDEGESDDFALRQDERTGHRASESERKQMMDVLCRLHALTEDVAQEDDAANANASSGINDADSTSSDSAHDEEEQADINLEEASGEELLQLLSPDERARFEAIVNDTSADKERARALLDKLLATSSNDPNNGKYDNDAKLHPGTSSQDDLPWWQCSRASNEWIAALDDTASQFDRQVKEMEASLPAKASPLQWNIIAVLLSYAFAIRNLGRPTLQVPGQIQTQSSHGQIVLSAGQRNNLYTGPTAIRSEAEGIARERVESLVPFLFVDGRRKPKSDAGFLDSSSNEQYAQTLLRNAEEATLWIVSRLGTECGRSPAATLLYLYKDVEALLREPKVAIAEAECQGISMLERAFADLYAIASKAAQRKLLFYAAVWSKSQCSKTIAEAIAKEMARLGAEVERAEDEERWRAAHEAVSKQDGVVLPP